MKSVYSSGHLIYVVVSNTKKTPFKSRSSCFSTSLILKGEAHLLMGQALFLKNHCKITQYEWSEINGADMTNTVVTGVPPTLASS